MQKTLEYINSELSSNYSTQEIRYISSLLIEKITGIQYEYLLINKSTNFSDEQRNVLNSFIDKLKKNIPIQYVLGETEFYGMPFIVNESTLIPRPETEELVEWIIHENSNNEKKNILDIGTGSGCIAISLKNRLPSSEIDAIDISEKALKVAKKNAEINKSDVNFIQQDLFSWQPIDKWNIIVSNPPYIPESEKRNIHENVLLYEPHEALFVPDDHALLFYEGISKFAAEHLNDKGKLYLEIHYDKGKEIVELLKKAGFGKIELRKDISHNERMVRAEIL